MSETRKRQHRVTVRLTEAEHAELSKRADNSRLTLAGYFRSATLDTPPPPQSRRQPVDRKELGKLLGAIGRIGNNINQLAKVANAGSWPESKSLHKACDDIRWIRRKLMEALGTKSQRKPRPGP
ncbi:MAG: plasmid mobilization relaxosome protein MobC [Nitrospinales bacterium]